MCISNHKVIRAGKKKLYLLIHQQGHSPATPAQGVWWAVHSRGAQTADFGMRCTLGVYLGSCYKHFQLQLLKE